MRKRLSHLGIWSAAAALAASALFSTGCDPTIQATVQNGIITTSQSLLTATLQAITALIHERNSQTSGTTTTGTNTTTGTGTNTTGTGTGTTT